MNQHRQPPNGTDTPDSFPSSGAQTPTFVGSPSQNQDQSQGDDESFAQQLQQSSSVLSSMWGLIRRFSSEDSQFGSQNTHSSLDAMLEQQHRQGKDGVNGVFNPTLRTASPFRPPPLEPIVLHGYKDSTPDTARLLSHAVAEEIRAMIPERLRIVEDWTLAYSLEQDGASLATLYQKCRQFEGRRVGFVLVVRDQEGSTFGAYLSEYPRPAPTYFGNGECFLWRASTLASLPPPPSADTSHLTRHTTLHPPHEQSHSHNSSGGSSRNSPAPSETIRFKAFPYSGLNDFYINCETGFLSVGSGGGHYGLWLDDSLDLGHSSQCETFGNEPLSDEGEKFGIIGVELWYMGS